MNKVLSSLFVIGAFFGAITSANAIHVAAESVSRAWGYDRNTNVETLGTYGDFIIDGSLTRQSVGTWSDEGAIVAVIATQVNEHGGYFCPYQIQCANKRKNTHSWTLYYQPNGFNASKCAWLCEAGYSGSGCQKAYHVDTSMETVDVIKNLRNGITRKTSGKDQDNYEGNVTGFNTWYKLVHTNANDFGEQDVILGAVKFLDHGIIAAPVLVGCDWDNWKDVTSWVGKVGLMSNTQKLLCKQGYRPNKTNSDCELATQDVLEKDNPVFCGNFPESGYNANLHRLVKKTDDNCNIYVCKDPNKAFPEAGKTDECVDCATSIRGGPSSHDGTCVVCSQLGEYFDVNSGDCKPAEAFTHLDLQFGRGMSKGDYENSVREQCWTMGSPDEYKKCVYGTKKSSEMKK